MGKARSGEGLSLLQPHGGPCSPAGDVDRAPLIVPPALPLSVALHKHSRPRRDLPCLSIPMGYSLPGPTTVALVLPVWSGVPNPVP